MPFLKLQMAWPCSRVPGASTVNPPSLAFAMGVCVSGPRSKAALIATYTGCRSLSSSSPTPESAPESVKSCLSRLSFWLSWASTLRGVPLALVITCQIILQFLGAESLPFFINPSALLTRLCWALTLVIGLAAVEEHLERCRILASFLCLSRCSPSIFMVPGVFPWGP